MTSKKSSNLWHEVCQYQPQKKLVKVLLFWWIAVVIITAVDMLNIFSGINALYLLCNVTLLFIFMLSMIDIVLLKSIAKKNVYQVNRSYPHNTAIFRPLDIEVLLTFLLSNLTKFDQKLINFFKVQEIKIELHDHYPDQLQLINTMPIQVNIDISEEIKDIYDTQGNKIADGLVTQILYSTRALERGRGIFNKTELKIHSPFGLFFKRISLFDNKSKELRILADFTGLLSNELSAVFEKSFDDGIQTIKEQGQGSEFLKLREYVVGDSMRQVDWKASSRQGRLMSKSYEDENDQDVVFLLDCSEQMRHRANSQDMTNVDIESKSNLSYFDKVLNAVFLLSYIANKQGDRVGLMTFGGANNGSEKFISPQKGEGLIRMLLNETTDLSPTLQTSDYFSAAERLKKSIKKRSLVILITNTRQEASNELIQGLQLISRQHQLVFANLTEQAVQDILDMKFIPREMDESLLYHSLISYKNTRDNLHAQLTQKTGALCLASTANQLPLVLTSAYIKMRNRK